MSACVLLNRRLDTTKPIFWFFLTKRDAIQSHQLQRIIRKVDLRLYEVLI